MYELSWYDGKLEAADGGGRLKSDGAGAFDGEWAAEPPEGKWPNEASRLERSRGGAEGWKDWG